MTLRGAAASEGIVNAASVREAMRDPRFLLILASKSDKISENQRLYALVREQEQIEYEIRHRSNRDDEPSGCAALAGGIFRKSDAPMKDLLEAGAKWAHGGVPFASFTRDSEREVVGGKSATQTIEGAEQWCVAAHPTKPIGGSCG